MTMQVSLIMLITEPRTVSKSLRMVEHLVQYLVPLIQICLFNVCSLMTT